VIVVTTAPALLARLVDDAATDPDGVVPLPEAIEDHRSRRASARHGEVIGALVVRASAVPDLLRVAAIDGLEVAVIADTGLERLGAVVNQLHAARVLVRRVEVAVAMRGEDPVPGVRRLIAVAGALSTEGTGGQVAVHAEIPLAGGMLDALDLLAGADAATGATFRIGGLAAELFPAPATLAGVLCACRDRGLRFTVNAGLHRALRHNDPETGFTHHGVLNLLAACLLAAAGASVPLVAERLTATDPLPLLEIVRARRDSPRPLWTAMTSGRVDDLIADFTGLGLLPQATS